MTPRPRKRQNKSLTGLCDGHSALISLLAAQVARAHLTVESEDYQRDSVERSDRVLPKRAANE